MSPPRKPKQTAFDSLGQRFEKLGKAMQNPQTGIKELAGLAYACGLILHFRFEPEETVEPEAEPQADTEGAT